MIERHERTTRLAGDVEAYLGAAEAGADPVRNVARALALLVKAVDRGNAPAIDPRAADRVIRQLARMEPMVISECRSAIPPETVDLGLRAAAAIVLAAADPNITADLAKLSDRAAILLQMLTADRHAKSLTNAVRVPRSKRSATGAAPDGSDQVAEVLRLLRAAAGSADVVEHCRLFSRAVASILARCGQIADDERDEMWAAIRAAMMTTAGFPNLPFNETRLEVGASATAYETFFWCLPPHLPTTIPDRLASEFRGYAIVFRNDLESAAELAQIARDKSRGAPPSDGPSDPIPAPSAAGAATVH